MPRLDPEAEARQSIDRQLQQCGWAVQDRRDMNISAALGVAIREFSLTTGEADYMLYADGRAIGVVEAKPVGHTLTGVTTQSGKYRDGLPNYRLPLPFAYESTGKVTQFTNILEPDARTLPLDRKPSIALDKILNFVVAGEGAVDARQLPAVRRRKRGPDRGPSGSL